MWSSILTRSTTGGGGAGLARGRAQGRGAAGASAGENQSPVTGWWHNVCRDRGTSRIFVALFDYDPPTMSPNPEACDEELPFREGQLIKVSPGRGGKRILTIFVFRLLARRMPTASTGGSAGAVRATSPATWSPRSRWTTRGSPGSCSRWDKILKNGM